MENRLIVIVIILIIWEANGWETSGWGAQPKVNVKNGTVYGKFAVTRRGRSILSFRGIPYAKAPIGSLRFRSPEPADGWAEPFYADSDPNVCPQVTLDGRPIGNEDCLKLSVYTPQLDFDNLLPVMVYIHGGEFVRGDAGATYQGPDFLLDHDIVLVAMQYRLGVLGFISTGDEIAPGNFGLKDQALALRWVQENIKSFGGDPDRVTLFGQSAGGVSVNFHVLSDYSKGLFHQFIAQSGSALCPWAFTELNTYKEYAFTLGKNYHCPTNSSNELIACLREVDAITLVSDDSIFPEVRKQLSLTWQPTNEPNIDGAFLTDIPIKRLLLHRVPDLPNISGVMKEEGLVVSSVLYANDTLYDSLLSDLDDFFTYITTSYVSDDTARSLATSIKNFYCHGIDIKNKTQVLGKLTDIISDASFVFPEVLQLQLAIKKLNSPHYLYSFEYRGTFSKTSYTLKNNKNIGASHSDDLIYLFPSDLAYFGVPETELSAEDHKMIDIMTELWTTFARDGKPRSSYMAKGEVWLPYEDNDNTHLRIGASSIAKVKLQKYFLDGRMHFWAMQILKMIFWSG